MAKGSGGDTTVANTKQSQTSTYDPTGMPIFKGVARGAQELQKTPYTPITQGVAGMTPDQLNALGIVTDAYGRVSPYMEQAAQYFNESAQPLTAEQINNYYNPMNEKVLAQMQNLFAQQAKQNWGKLVGQAGGVGSAGVLSGQANLANQQALGYGATAAQMWENALQGAENEQGRKQASAYGLGNLSQEQLSQALQAAGFQFGVGQTEQQTEQNRLNALYAQQMAQAAFPFQKFGFTAPFQLQAAGQMGGTSKGKATGTQTTNPPDPSIWGQIAGGLTAGVGLGNQMFGGGSPMFGNSGWLYGGPGSMYGNGWDATVTPESNRGGAVKMAAGGVPNIMKADGYVPDVELPPLSAPVPPTLVPAAIPQSQPVSGNSGGGSNIMDTAMKALPMIMAMANRGGAIHKEGGGFLSGLSNLVNPDKGSWGSMAPFMGVLPAMMASGKGYGPMAGGFANQLTKNPTLRAGMNNPSPAGVGTMGTMNPYASIGGLAPFSMFGRDDGGRINHRGEPFGILARIARGKGGEVHKAGGGPFGEFIKKAYAGGIGSQGDTGTFSDWILSHRPKVLDSPFANDRLSAEGVNILPSNSGRTSTMDKTSQPPLGPNVTTVTKQGVVPRVEDTFSAIQTPPTASPFAGDMGGYAPIQSGEVMAGNPDRVDAQGNLIAQGDGGDYAAAPDVAHEKTDSVSPAGVQSGLPPMPDTTSPFSKGRQEEEVPGLSGRWAAAMGAAGMPQPAMLFGKPLSNTNLALISAGLGMMASGSPYAGVAIGEGGLKGIEALKAFQQLDAQRQAQALQNMLAAGRLDVDERQQNLAEWEKPFKMKANWDQQHWMGNMSDEDYNANVAQLAKDYPQMGHYLESQANPGGQPAPVAPESPNKAVKVPVDGKELDYPEPVYPEGTNKDYYVPVDSIPGGPEGPDQYNRGLSSKPAILRAQARTTAKLKQLDDDNRGAADGMRLSYEANGHLTELINHPGLFGMGPGADLRNQIGNAAQLLSQFTGIEMSPENMKALTSGFALKKLHTYAGFNLARTLGTREAMQVIQQALAAVYNQSMPPDAAKEIIHSMQIKIRMNMDRAQFVNKWNRASRNNVVDGAEEYFDRYVGTPAKYNRLRELTKKLDKAYQKATPDEAAAWADKYRNQYGIEPSAWGNFNAGGD